MGDVGDDDGVVVFEAKLYEDQKTESQNIATFLAKALRKYRDINQCLPERIFIFRDGIGEGMVSAHDGDEDDD